MTESALQALCERGSRELIRTRYLDAAGTFAAAEAAAWDGRDFDTLSRLYLPLQEARRQARQRCGEGIVELSVVATGPGESVDADMIVSRYPHGQLLVAGWGSCGPAVEVRRLATERGLYLETFLALARPDGTVVVLPTATSTAGVEFAAGELPRSPRRGSTATFAEVMALWERLHEPYLAAAELETDPVRKMEKFRAAIEVDPACELAHQHLATAARELARGSTASAE